MVATLDFTTDDTRPWRWGACLDCPLNPPNVVRGFGSSVSGITIIGESPGRLEVDHGRPFIGPSGQLIRAVLAKLDQNPDEAYWTNSLLCHAEKPVKQAIVACNHRLREETRDVRTKKVLLLGAIALQSIRSPSKQQSITNQRGMGFCTEIDGVPVYALATYHPAAVLRDPDLFRDLVFDVQKFLNSDAPVAAPSPHVYVSWNEEQACRRLPLLLAASRLSCDIETSGLSSKSDMIISVGFGVKRQDGEIECHIIPSYVMEKPIVKDLLLRFYTEYGGKLIFHNGKFDLRMLSVFHQQSLQPRGFTDTLLMRYTLDERASSEHTFGRKIVPKRFGLKTLSRLYFDTVYGFDFAEFWKSEPKKEDWERLFYYQGLDCAFTLELEERFASEMEQSQHTLLTELLYPASFALQGIENHGIKIDMSRLRALDVEVERELAVMGAKLTVLAEAASGIDDWRTPTQKKAKNTEPADFNPGSYAHVKRLVYDVWKTPHQMSMTHLAKQRRKEGKEYWSTDDITLTRLAEQETDPVRADILKTLIEWRRAKTLLSKDIRGLARYVDSDERARSSFMIHGTVTGRLSSKSPNLQNVPSRDPGITQKIKSLFCPGPDWSLVEADYSQLEVRVLAEFSEDETLKEACRTGDIHGNIASQVFQKPPDQISHFERVLTKTMVFGTIYGRSAKGLVNDEAMGELVKQGMRRWTESEAQSFIDRLFALYPGMNQFFKKAKEDALRQHYVEYSRGRRRRFPFVSSTNRDEILRQAVNAPVQGTASDICLDALVRLHRELDGREARVLSTVHDSILLEVRTDALADTTAQIRTTMETVRIIPTTIPFKVKIKAGPDWASVEEVA